MGEDAFQRAVERLARRRDLSPSKTSALNNVLNSTPDAQGRNPVDSGPQPVGAVDPGADTETLSQASNFRSRFDTFVNAPPEVLRAGSNPFQSGRDGQTRKTRPATSPIAGREKIGRFHNLGLIGRGGMGEVYRGLDPDLDRRMVLKVLRDEHIGDPSAIHRFLEEARITSQLDHPGIVPVHELGALDDERLFFAMREVRGRTLDEVIDETHANFDGRGDDEYTWNAHFHNLIDIFYRVCEPIAYAHSRGIIHRDLKPSNIMVGDFGEVQVLDWGLAKFFDTSMTPTSNTDIGALTADFDDSGIDTGQGTIVGTPAYMPPEQAYGKLDTLGPATDVYSLGVILFQVLEGTRPFSGPNAAAILFQVVEGIQCRPGPDNAPEALVELCLDAMNIDRTVRPDDAAVMADTIADWRTGSDRRNKAIELVAAADEILPEVDRLRDRARDLERRSRRMLYQIPDSSPVEDKRPAWALHEEAELLEREAGTRRARAIQKLDAALAHVPDLDQAHHRLASIYRREHAEAERRRHQTRATSLEVFLRAHNTGAFDEYLEGTGHVDVDTRPPGARIDLFRYVQHHRRLTPSLKRLLGHSPVSEKPLAMGSYLLRIQAAGRATIRYPVYIGRCKQWTGNRPDRDEPFRIYLPFDDELGDDDIYIPGSFYWRGGDERATNSPPRSIRWVDPFVIQKFPVTHREYLTFINDLVDQGHIDEARQRCPRNIRATGYGGEIPVYQLGDDGRYRPRSKVENFLQLPVNLIDWHDARAYAKWLSTKTSLPWRLPTSDEWEKAARGVDGRFFPWGDYLDPTWCRMVQSTTEAPGPVPVGDVDTDESPYGMRDAAGNIREWCLPDDAGDIEAIDDDTAVPFRGGCWFSTPAMCRLASRQFKPPSARSAGIGFRLARDLAAAST